MVAMVLIVATTTFVHAQPRPDELPSFRFGGGLVDMGVNVGPYRLLEPSTSVGFDLRMRWPSPATLGDLSAFQPYFLLGPTFVMTDPDHITRTLDPHADTTYGLGVRAGAGVNWSLDPNSTLYGEYHVQAVACAMAAQREGQVLQRLHVHAGEFHDDVTRADACLLSRAPGTHAGDLHARSVGVAEVGNDPEEGAVSAPLAAHRRLNPHVRRRRRLARHRRHHAHGQCRHAGEPGRVDLLPGVGRPVIVAVRSREQEEHRPARRVEGRVIGRREGIATELERQTQPARRIVEDLAQLLGAVGAAHEDLIVADAAR